MKTDPTSISIHKKTGAGAPAISGATPPMTDIFDIKPLEIFGVDPDLFKWSIIAGTALLFILGSLFFFLWKRKKKSPPKAPEIPPDQKALDRLAALKNDPNPDGKRFYFKLSEILRDYIHGRFHVPALEMTSEELIEATATLSLNESLKQGLIDFVKRADPVKFAGKPPEFQQMKNDLLMADRFVRRTAPPAPDSCAPPSFQPEKKTAAALK